jgi:hypothetical protein
VTRSNNSLINYLSINENFPVAGQDNDTQVFRDNADTIKNSLRNAKDEITDVLTNAAFKDEDNDFELKKISRAVFQNCRDEKFDGRGPTPITVSPLTIDYEQGSYQIYKIGAAVSMDFLNFPGDPALTGEITPIGIGKVTLELYSDGSSRNLSFLTSGGTVIKSNGFPGYASGSPILTLTSATNPVLIEVWRHGSDVIYMRYIGAFA